MDYLVISFSSKTWHLIGKSWNFLHFSIFWEGRCLILWNSHFWFKMILGNFWRDFVVWKVGYFLDICCYFKKSQFHRSRSHIDSKYGISGAGASGGSGFWKMTSLRRIWRLLLVLDSPSMGFQGQRPPAGQDFEKWYLFLFFNAFVKFLPSHGLILGGSWASKYRACQQNQASWDNWNNEAD